MGEKGGGAGVQTVIDSREMALMWEFNTSDTHVHIAPFSNFMFISREEGAK